jgi:2-deoxy-D-gluconate 3-dehydrogenase
MKILDFFNLEGKVALVTGCKRGIGKAMAIGLAQAGADIIGVSASLELTDSEVEKEVKSLGRKFYAYQCDFKKRADLYDFIGKVKKECPKVDILINNAGNILRKPAAEHPDEFWDEIMEINLNSQFILAREFGKEMIEKGSGKIIFTASLLTFQGGINVPSYAASKAGIGSLVKALANEWASKGVNVNAIALVISLRTIQPHFALTPSATQVFYHGFPQGVGERQKTWQERSYFWLHAPLTMCMVLF